MTVSDFHFLRPLWLLALVPLAGLLWALLRADGEGDAWRGVVDRHLLPSLLSEAGDSLRRAPLVLLGLAWLLAVLALAGPTWQRLPEPLYQARQYRVIALDLSATMNATDLAPSRLARARYKVLDLLYRSEEGQTALLAYGPEPYVVSPLTGDVQTIAAQVPLLEPGLLPVAGDRRADLVLERAGELLRQAEAPDGQVILVTDALDHPAAAIEAARRLRGAGYGVSVLGIGTDRGGPVAGPDGGLAKDANGAIRIARLDLAALRELADAGGGRYVTIGADDRDIAALTPQRSRAAQMQDETQQTEADRWREEGPWLLLALLPLAAMAFRRGWLAPLLLLIGLVPAPDVYALGWDDLWLSPDQRATRLFTSGQSDEAARLFERPDWRAAAHYQANDYAQALQSLEKVEGPSADYNRGNALARMDKLEDAIRAYEEALSVDPGNADARHNRDLVQRVLEQRRQQQEDDNADQNIQKDQTQSGESEQAQQSEQAAPSEQVQQDQSDGQGGGQDDQASEQADAEAGTEGEPSPQQAGQDAALGQRQAQDGKGQDSSTRPSTGQEEQEQQTAGQDVGGTDTGARQADAQGSAGQGDTPGNTLAEGSQDESAPPSGPGQQQSQAQDQPQLEQEGTAQPEAPMGAGSTDTGPPDPAGQQPAPAPGQEGRRDGAQTQGQETPPSPAGLQSPPKTAQNDSGDAAGGRHDATAQSQSPTSAGAEGRDAGFGAPDTQTPGLADLLGDQGGSTAGGTMAQRVPGMDPEDQQAIEQILRRVDDDPGGLLRQRFLLQHLRRTGRL